MRLVWDQSDAVAAWVAKRCPYVVRGFDPCVAAGVVSEDGRVLLGGVVFHHFHPEFKTIEVSLAAITPRWLTRRILQQLMAYPFDQLKCQRITTGTPKKYKAARKFLQTFGFKHEGTVRKGFGNDDAIISGLMAWEWRRSKWAPPANSGPVAGTVYTEAEELRHTA